MVRQEVAPETLSRSGRFVLNDATGAHKEGLAPAAVLLYVFEDTDVGEQGGEYSLSDLLSVPIGFVEK